MNSELKHIGIVGGGKMGTSLFNYLSECDLKITWYRRSLAEKAQSKYDRKLKRLSKNDIITNDDFEFRSTHQIITDDFSKLSEPDLIIECIKEDYQEKINLFQELDMVAKESVILASNSSSITPHDLQQCCKRIKNVVGLHFFYPIELKNIVEFITTVNTSADTICKIEAFLNSINKFYLKQEFENAFLLNRLMLNIQAGACHLTEKENISFSDIDAVVRKNLFPIGIFEMLDHIGIDVMNQSVNNYLKNETEKEFYLPLLKLLDLYHSTNRLGIKTGLGFYNYPSDIEINNSVSRHEITVTKYLLDIFNKTVDSILIENKCKAEDLTFAMNEYLDTDTGEWNKVLH